MAKIVIGNYVIEVLDEPTYKVGSSDNSFKYDFVYQEQDVELYAPISKHGIKILKNDNVQKSALLLAVGGGTGIYENSFLIDGNNIVVCCSDNVFCLSIPDLELNWNVEADQITCFKIFKIESGYLIHGEMSITKLNFMGEILWQNGGKDIFVNLEGKKEFEFFENSILATDFNGEQYRFDFDGNNL